ncbi:MAG: glucose-6-phosphate isomerase [Bacteroidales bacterium]
MNEKLTINIDGLSSFIPMEEVFAAAAKSTLHLDILKNGTGEGNNFLGWLTLPEDISVELEKIQACASRLREISDTTVVIGIGGSYLGSKAVIEALTDNFAPFCVEREHQILFAGQNLCSEYLHNLLKFLDKRDYTIIVISKSGTTTEPAVAFRLLRAQLEAKVGSANAAERIVAITDSERGALKRMADKEGYETFAIADNVGGRYSVLSPVGLLPIAVAGLNIREFVRGSSDMQALTISNHDQCSNPALLYAAARNLLYQEGKIIEIMVNYTPSLHCISEWWKQLFGESEGKEGKGIFPASVDNTTDLHSMGQYIQDGERRLFETVLSVATTATEVIIPSTAGDEDNLNYLAGKTLSFINSSAEQGTREAHIEGGVPNLTIVIPRLNEYYLGQLLYFFEVACGVSGYILGVNPFDQPGVEAYKNKMFKILGKA